MDDLISRQAAINAVFAWREDYKTKGINVKPLVDWLKDLPTAQPERKKGKWIDDQDPIIVSGTCSCCGWEAILFETDVAGMPYCPNCGAAMEGGEAECS